MKFRLKREYERRLRQLHELSIFLMKFDRHLKELVRQGRYRSLSIFLMKFFLSQDLMNILFPILLSIFLMKFLAFC